MTLSEIPTGQYANVTCGCYVLVEEHNVETDFSLVRLLSKCKRHRTWLGFASFESATHCEEATFANALRESFA